MPRTGKAGSVRLVDERRLCSALEICIVLVLLSTTVESIKVTKSLGTVSRAISFDAYDAVTLLAGLLLCFLLRRILLRPMLLQPDRRLVIYSPLVYYGILQILVSAVSAQIPVVSKQKKKLINIFL